MNRRSLLVATFAAALVMPRYVHGQVSVAPCSLEQYRVPSSASIQSERLAHLTEDIRLAHQIGEEGLLLGVLCFAAAAGNTEGMLALSLLTYSGEGLLGQSDAQARVWLERMPVDGPAMAQYMLAKLYLEGRGGAQRVVDAEQLLIRAANAGVGEAKLDLVLEYASGERLPRSLQQALFWARAARASGVDRADELVSIIESQMQGEGVR
ncbi:MAG: sel1 repeat family protein [bacterium]|nr:sel1 repeat family protein [bacterium]